MTSTIEQEITAVPWYKSAVIQRLALSITLQIIGMTPAAKALAGIDWAPIVNDVLEAVGVLFAAAAVHARATKPAPPLTLTKAKAEKANEETFK